MWDHTAKKKKEKHLQKNRPQESILGFKAESHSSENSSTMIGYLGGYVPKIAFSSI